MQARVIALGQAAAGDDGVGFAVLEELRRRGVPEHVELLRALDATALLSLLETPATVVLVDAALGLTPGEVIELAVDELPEQGVRTVSSHGMGVGQVVGLARLLSPERVSPSIRVIAVTIAHPDRFHDGLSPVVAAAVGRAANRVLRLVEAWSPRLPGRSSTPCWQRPGGAEAGYAWLAQVIPRWARIDCMADVRLRYRRYEEPDEIPCKDVDEAIDLAAEQMDSGEAWPLAVVVDGQIVLAQEDLFEEARRRLRDFEEEEDRR